MQPDEPLPLRHDTVDQDAPSSPKSQFQHGSEPCTDAQLRSKPAIILLDPKSFTRRLIADMLALGFPGYAISAAGDVEELLHSTEEDVGAAILIVLYVRSVSVLDPFLKQVLKRLETELPNIPIILLSDRDDLMELKTALMQGVRGYIPTSMVYDVALAALRLIEAGGTYMPPDIIELDIASSHRIEHQDRDGEQVLTPRELAIMELLRTGKPNKVIATVLNMQESTVKVHVRNILRKLHASNRTHAVSVATQIFDQPKK
jgi:DNA-binding NarL/FixJ family response regulator